MKNQNLLLTCVVVFIVGMLLLLSVPCQAEEICIEGVCRSVEIGPLAVQTPLRATELGKVRKVLNVLTNHVTLDFIAGGSSAFRTYSTYECRELGVEPCTAHYGSAKGTEIAASIGTGVAIWLSEYGRKNGFKEWFVPEVVITAFNFAYGARELRAKHPVEREK